LPRCFANSDIARQPRLSAHQVPLRREHRLVDVRIGIGEQYEVSESGLGWGGWPCSLDRAMQRISRRAGAVNCRPSGLGRPPAPLNVGRLANLIVGFRQGLETSPKPCLGFGPLLDVLGGGPSTWVPSRKAKCNSGKWRFPDSDTDDPERHGLRHDHTKLLE